MPAPGHPCHRACRLKRTAPQLAQLSLSNDGPKPPTRTAIDAYQNLHKLQSKLCDCPPRRLSAHFHRSVTTVPAKWWKSVPLRKREQRPTSKPIESTTGSQHSATCRSGEVRRPVPIRNSAKKSQAAPVGFTMRPSHGQLKRRSILRRSTGPKLHDPQRNQDHRRVLLRHRTSKTLTEMG
jgi:hypothetical protein